MKEEEYTKKSKIKQSYTATILQRFIPYESLYKPNNLDNIIS